MRVLLLNPPFDRPCIRDNYCSYTSKAGDLWSPVDLLVQSGILGRRHEVEVLDAVARRVSSQECLTELERLKPQALLMLTGTLSWAQDVALLRRATAARPGMRVVLTGDFLLKEARQVLERFPFVSGVLSDYTVDSLDRWLAGETGPFPALHLREVEAVRAVAANGHEFAYPVPRHDLFPADRYRLSLTSDLDPNFTARPARARHFCRLVHERGLKPSFVCNAQVACLSDELIDELAAAGCHTVMLGLETGVDEMLARHRKGFDTARARHMVERCREAGIRVLAYFLLGLPGEDADGARRTVDFALSLPLDYVSFNVFSPLPGTELGRPFLDSPESCDGGRDRSLSPPASFCAMTAADLADLRRRAYLRFYGRPSYLWHQLARVRTPGDLARLTRAAWRLASNALR
ncbi:MAG: radical SAM protein [Candidatus Riflebacteria bacterium]|nr:radical SAM protein [Candidatus Riflebacteria bacterium]